MAGITERNQQKLELANAGFTLRYIDEWQPKTTLYRHKPIYNINRQISQDIGSEVKGVPGSPDYVLRKAKIGLFPWKPGEQCECQWCKEASAKLEETCKSCDTVLSGKNAAGLASSKRHHNNKYHK